MKTTQAETVAVAVAAIFAAYTAGADAALSEVKAFGKVLRAAPLGDAEWVTACKAELTKVFGDAHKDAMQYRLNILNNARRIAHGGEKDGRKVKGKGTAAVVAVLDGCDSMRDLKAAMAEAVPAALKGKAGGKRKGAGKTSAKGKANGISIGKVATREEAYAAARKVLEFCRDQFTPPSDGKRSKAIDSCIAALTL